VATKVGYGGEMSLKSYLMNDRWSLETWFVELGGEAYEGFKADLIKEVGVLQREIVDEEVEVAILAEWVVKLEGFGERLGLLAAYLGCRSADDANDERVKAEESWLATLAAEQTKVVAVMQAGVARLGEEAFALLLKDERMAGAEHAVRRMREQGGQQMAGKMEALAADLNVNGLHAWGRLYDTLTGQMAFEMTFPDGHLEQVPMARRRALMAAPDRALREAAFVAGQKPWQDHGVTLAAALNGIAGTRLSLDKHRGVSHFLDTALFDGAMKRSTLDAMLEAIHADIELPRRAIRMAAKLQGTQGLHFFDLEAPQVTPPDQQTLSWQEACATVEGAFGNAYPALASYFREMLEKRWIEAEPRVGKRPGAFCTGSRLRKEERIYLTFHGTVHDMVTLAHEAGHAWHSRVLRPARSLAAHYPMTLAETASNFGEMILLNGLLDSPSISVATKAYLLDQEMLRAHAYLVNIPMRYEFERAFYTERQQGEVAVTRLNRLMMDAQRKLYGDGLMEGGEDPWFWASKMHFFITDVSFYNFPYLFGYLLSQALFAKFKQEGPSFLPRYESFLQMTGSASCEQVVMQSLGEDITSPEFWSTAVHAMEGTLQQYEALKFEATTNS